MDRTELQVINKCQQGELKQFSWLYDRYARKIYDFVYYKTMHQETAQDLTSQTFLKALSGLPSFDASQGSFSAWLYRIARNNVIDHYRSQKNDQDISTVWDLSNNSSLADEVADKITLEKVRQYLEQLSAQQKDIIIMRLWDGLSYQEIANITDQSETNCRMIVSRGLKKIQAVLLTVVLIIASIIWTNL
ncbi:MAG: RNA polymerase sigma factor [bacterium]